MKIRKATTVDDVKAVYSGHERDLWELLMGEQIHVGGMASSLELADKAKVGPGMKGIDLCCGTGAGMRFLCRMKHVDAMRGVDFTHSSVIECRKRAEARGFMDCIRATEADVCTSGLPDGEADFVWGEGSWCYVPDKVKLISEAVRLVKKGGTIAFTDWMEGEGLTDKEADRAMGFLKFPSLYTPAEYKGLLEKNACKILCAEDTGLLPKYADLYAEMLTSQHKYDALRCLGFDPAALENFTEEFLFVQKLVHKGKIIQGRVIAQK
jgi:ubiquinone/menaquinone biosynthesis C-methylase UbiE